MGTLTLKKEDFSGELFLDEILRKVNSKFDDTQDKNKVLNINIAEFSWANDLQLTSIPFIVSYLKEHQKIDVSIDFPLEGLFTENTFFNYLHSSAFFEFLEKHNIRVNKGKRPLSTPIIDENFIEFQAFNDVSSQKLAASFQYQFSGKLRAFFRKDIFHNESTAESLARTIAKETIQNITLHSNASMAVVRFKYYSDPLQFRDFNKFYSNTPLISEYAEKYKDTPMFAISISDNGDGIIETIKNKYKDGIFIPKKNEKLQELLSSKNNNWLIRAFDSHKIKGEDIRARRGLKEILEVIKEYNGFIFIRSSNASASYNSYKSKFESSLLNPDISGTHFLILLPAKIKKEALINDILFYKDEVHPTVKEASNLTLEEFPMSYHKNVTPLYSSIEESHKNPKLMLNELSAILEGDIFKTNKLIELDFSNSIDEHSSNYEFILQRLVDKYKSKIGQHCIIRNASNHLIAKFKKSELQRVLHDNKIILITFNTSDRFTILGAEPKVEKEIIMLYENNMLDYSKLSKRTLDIIKNNNLLIRIGQHKGYQSVAYILDFNSIFKKKFNHLITVEQQKSGALLSGPFRIKSKIRVENYLNAPLLFQNPKVCRMIAKEIYKLVEGSEPDRLVTYSTTGIIMYYYLKNFYINDLELLLLNSNDLSLRYGQEINENEKTLVLVDIKSTGELLRRIRNRIISHVGSAENIVNIISIFDINLDKKIVGFPYKSLFTDIQIPFSTTSQPIKGDEVVLDIDPLTAAPNIYQREYSNLSVINERTDLLNTLKPIQNPKQLGKVFKRIENTDLSEFALIKYWESLDFAFQTGHVERKDSHFKHYDIPERLLFNNSTLFQLESYIKDFIWSFARTDFIKYIIYPRDITAAYLAHIVASRFLKKPIVAEARSYEDGVFVLPAEVANKLNGMNVLLVDDSINTGTTMLGLIGLINIYGGNVTGLFTITNRVSQEIEMTLRSLVANITCAYQLDLGVFQSSQCPLCSRRNAIVNKIQTSATKEYNEYLNQELTNYEIQEYQDK